MNEDRNRKKHIKNKRLKKALKYTDPCLTLFHLKNISLDSSVLFDEEMMDRLLSFIKTFISCDFPIKTDFGEFMNSFMKRIKTESQETHIRCLSLIYINGMIIDRDNHLQYYRSLFSYSKIYSIFKEQMKNIFVEGLEPEFLEYLILLLNNNKLVYKHILPVIQKISTFVDQNIVDKSIVNCCILLKSITRIYPENLNPTFIASILTYLIDLLLDSQNFVFISLPGSKIILDTIRVQSEMILQSKDVEIDLKKISLGLMRKLVEAIKKYKHSTVYEEIMVVVSATGCLECILKLFIKFENRNIDFIDSDLLSFTVFERAKKIKNGTDELKFVNTPSINKENSFEEDTVRLDFERPFKNHYNAHHQVIRDEFIINKYRFLDLFWSVTNNIDERFKRIEFYNDLTKIEQSYRLFPIIKNIKYGLDWSDLIVFACNAPNKENYIPLIFDRYFLEKQNHQVFLEIFLKNLCDSPNNLVYFTKYCIDMRMMDLLAKLYLVDLNNDENPCKKKREMIIRFIASLGQEESELIKEEETNPIKSKEVNITTEEHPADGNLIEKVRRIEIKEIISPDKENKESNEKQLIEIDIKKLIKSEEVRIFVETLTEELEYLHQNLIPLFIVLLYKRLENETLIKFLEKINLKMGNKEDQYRPESFVSVFSIYCCIYRINYFEDHDMVTDKDMFISMMCLKLGNFDSGEADVIKIKSFDVMMKLKDEDVLIGKEIYVFENENNEYIKEINHIIMILRSK